MKNKSKADSLPSSANVHFNLVDVRTLIKNKASIRLLIKKLFINEGKTLKEISYNFCSDDYLLDINNSYLSHDYYTDIITFDLTENNAIVGDVYISVNTVKDNAVSNGVDFKNELLRVIIHGALHLCGYKDKTQKQIKLMRSKEDYYLSLR